MTPVQLKEAQEKRKKQGRSDSDNLDKVYPGYSDHKNDSEGSWCTRSCKTAKLGALHGSSTASQEEMDEYAREMTEFYANNPDEIIILCE